MEKSKYIPGRETESVWGLTFSVQVSSPVDVALTLVKTDEELAKKALREVAKICSTLSAEDTLWRYATKAAETALKSSKHSFSHMSITMPKETFMRLVLSLQPDYIVPAEYNLQDDVTASFKTAFALDA